MSHQRHRVVARLHTDPRRRFRHCRRLVAQRLEQTQHAVRARRGAEQHRADDAFAQFLGQVVKYLVARRLHVLEQLLHQLVVVIGKRLEHRVARFLLTVAVLAGKLDDLGRGVLFVDIGAFEREIDETGDDVVSPDRNLPQQQMARARPAAAA